jgi:hypothetical protein
MPMPRDKANDLTPEQRHEHAERVLSGLIIGLDLIKTGLSMGLTFINTPEFGPVAVGAVAPDMFSMEPSSFYEPMDTEGAAPSEQ